MTNVLIIGGVIAFLLLVVGLIASAREEKKFVAERLDRFTKESEGVVVAPRPTASAFAEFLTSQATRFSWGQSLSRELARADIKLRVGEYILIMIIVAVGLGFVTWSMGGRETLAAMIGVVIGLFLPRIYVGRLKNRRLQRFDDQLGDMLSLMVNGLRAGYSTMQALEAVAKELPPPICDEFRRVVQEMQIGLSMEAALANLVRRVPSKDLDLVVTAMNVQREVGGALAEILDTLSETIRERVRIKGEIRVLTSQQTFSARFLSILPILVILALYFANRDYMSNFYKRDQWFCFGIGALVLAGMMIIIGYTVMKKIGEIEV